MKKFCISVFLVLLGIVSRVEASADYVSDIYPGDSLVIKSKDSTEIRASYRGEFKRKNFYLSKDYDSSLLHVGVSSPYDNGRMPSLWFDLETQEITKKNSGLQVHDTEYFEVTCLGWGLDEIALRKFKQPKYNTLLPAERQLLLSVIREFKAAVQEFEQSSEAAASAAAGQETQEDDEFFAISE